jgi:phospholipid/cholesterol/gamma-HCH transport system substrate-binding protein
MSSPSRGERFARTVERVKTEPGLARNTIVVIALIAIAGIVGGVVLANQRFVPPWDDRQVFYAEFEATPGVSPGNGQEVRVAGVAVGDIVEADVDQRGHARLKLSIEPGHKIYENAKLTLRPKSPLNEMYVTINPGAPPAKEIPANYQFPVANSVRPIQIDEVLDHLDDNAQEALTSLLAESDISLTNAKANFPQGLDATRTVANDLRPVAEQLSIRKDKIRALITALGEISQAIGGDDKRVQTLADGLQTTLRAFGSHEPQFDQTLATLPGVVKNLRRSTGAVQELSDQLDPTLRDLQKASDSLPDALKDLRGTADKLDDVVDAARPFLHAARPVLADLRPFANDLHDALPPLHQATKALDPLTRGLVPYLPDVAAFTINTRSIVSAEDANGGLLRGFVYADHQFVPPVFGANNGLKPVPAPPGLNAIPKGEQQLIPVGPGGQPGMPQDGSRPRTAPNKTPDSDDTGSHDSGPKPGSDHSPGGLLPLGTN